MYIYIIFKYIPQKKKKIVYDKILFITKTRNNVKRYHKIRIIGIIIILYTNRTATTIIIYNNICTLNKNNKQQRGSAITLCRQTFL